MEDVVFCTFSKSHGLTPGLMRHGVIDVWTVTQACIFPTNCVHANVDQLDITYRTSEGEIISYKQDSWGLSWNLFNMCKPITEVTYPFHCHMTIDVHFGEFE